jgi:spore coat polysaccharide biosynthesis predicted glycosyltransferase SpsG
MVIFRADVSALNGLRHLCRCAHLASLLKKSNRVLVCAREDKRAAKFMSEKNIPFILAKDPAKIDLAGVRAIVFDLAPFSAPDNKLLEKAKESGMKTVQIIADEAERQTVDITVYPFIQAENALLHHKFRHFHQVRRKYRKATKLVFIHLGDLLPYRDLRAIVDTLHRLRFKMKISPGLSLKKADKRNLMKIYPGIHFSGKSESPARAYFEADLALIMPGEEALEAACVGTPALYMPLDKSQDTLADTCAGMGTGVKIPPLADFSVQALRDALAPLTPERREKMGAAGKALVDGLGVQRFFKVLKDNGIIE